MERILKLTITKNKPVAVIISLALLVILFLVFSHGGANKN